MRNGNCWRRRNGTTALKNSRPKSRQLFQNLSLGLRQGLTPRKMTPVMLLVGALSLQDRVAWMERSWKGKEVRAGRRAPAVG